MPVIPISGYVGTVAASRSDSGLADDVIVEPMRTNALATSMARVLAVG